MPKGTPGYFKQIDPYGGYVSVDDPMFEAKVRAKIGDPYKDLVDKSKAQNVMGKTDKYSLLGINSGREPSLEKREMALRKIGVEGKLDPSKSVLGIGAGASPQTFAHEFRHDKYHDEESNRLQDLMYADSKPQYASAVQSAYEHITGETGEKVPFTKKEARVLRHFSPKFPDDFDFLHHINLNQGDNNIVGEFLRHPVEMLKGQTVDMADTTEPGSGRSGLTGVSTIKERVKYPFLNFIGSSDIPDPSKYKRGGSIENTTHDRKMI